MVLNVHRNHKACYGPGQREKGRGKEVRRWGKKEIIYLSLHCHRQNDSCIKMGSDESRLNVSLIVRDKVTIANCPKTDVPDSLDAVTELVPLSVPVLVNITLGIYKYLYPCSGKWHYICICVCLPLFLSTLVCLCVCVSVCLCVCVSFSLSLSLSLPLSLSNILNYYSCKLLFHFNNLDLVLLDVIDWRVKLDWVSKHGA